MSLRHRLRRIRRAVLADQAGSAALIVALAIVPTFGAVGLAIDSSMGYMLKSRMSKSLDAAALAAGRVALSDDAEDVAREYFDTNFRVADSVVVTDFEY
jgi:Flp pilus assembly protein TadG